MLTLADLCLDHPGGGSPLVRDANLRVTRGEVVLIVGAAGVGTSRLVSAVLGEVAPASGTIEIFGRDLGKLRRSSLRLLRRRIGVVPQDLCLLEERSAQLNVALPLEIDGVPRSASIARALGALTSVGLSDEASLPVECLSGASRQRVAVARALVRSPELVVADHPTSLQDAEGAELVCSALADAAADGAAVVVCGRDPALRAIADRHGWAQLGLVRGVLRPLGLTEIEGRSIDELLLDMSSASNVLPFPTAGVA